MDVLEERGDAPDDFLPFHDGGVDRHLPTFGEATITASSFARSLGQLPRVAIGGAL